MQGGLTHLHTRPYNGVSLWRYVGAVGGGWVDDGRVGVVGGGVGVGIRPLGKLSGQL